MKIEICYSPSGFGLANDAEILRETLWRLGYSSIVSIIPNPKSHSFFSKIFTFVMRATNGLYLYRSALRALSAIKKDTVIIHLENVNYLKLFSRGVHVLIPNQEWYDPSRLELLTHLYSVWCKTRLAESIFSELRCNTRYIGFRSTVNKSLVQTQPDAGYFFSRTGMSAYRGAQLLIDTWARNPQWPTLKIVIHPSRRPEYKPNNVEFLDVFESKESYNQLASGSLFHIYATETEGFGHSIVEALGYGAIVIALDAPPMNEILNRDCALLVKSYYLGQKRLSPRFRARIESLEDTVNQALGLRDDEARCLSNNAKHRYSTISDQFPMHLEDALLCVIKRND